MHPKGTVRYCRETQKCLPLPATTTINAVWHDNKSATKGQESRKTPLLSHLHIRAHWGTTGILLQFYSISISHHRTHAPCPSYLPLKRCPVCTLPIHLMSHSRVEKGCFMWSIRYEMSRERSECLWCHGPWYHSTPHVTPLHCSCTCNTRVSAWAFSITALQVDNLWQHDRNNSWNT